MFRKKQRGRFDIGSTAGSFLQARNSARGRLIFEIPPVVTTGARAGSSFLHIETPASRQLRTSSAGVRARPASCTPDDTASRRLQDIYKKADAAELASWQFFGFHIVKNSDRTNNPIRQLHPILFKGNPSASHNTLPLPPRDSNITSRVPLVSEAFLDISATRGGAEAETKGGRG